MFAVFILPAHGLGTNLKDHLDHRDALQRQESVHDAWDHDEPAVCGMGEAIDLDALQDDMQAGLFLHASPSAASWRLGLGLLALGGGLNRFRHVMDRWRGLENL